jgi:hypothetical protein
MPVAAFGLRRFNCLTARSRRQGGQDGIRIVAHEVNGAIREQEVRSSGVLTPEVQKVANVLIGAGAEMVRTS